MARTRRLDDLLHHLILPSDRPAIVREDSSVTGVTSDSRKLVRGNLFVALTGEHDDGVRYLADAFGKQATAAVVRRGADVRGALLPVFETEDPYRALAVLARRFYREPDQALALIGVTGTNGKTTIASLIAHFLVTSDQTTAYWTTSWVDSGAAQLRPTMTTPSPPELYRFLDQARLHQKSHAVLEISSHAVTLERIYGLEFEVGVISNISPDHLDFHGSYRNYVHAKSRFMRGLGPSATAVINGDDPVTREFIGMSRAPSISFGLGSQNDLRAVFEPGRTPDGGFGLLISPRLAARYRIARTEQMLWAHSPLPGEHNVRNVLAAVAAGIGLGLQAPLMLANLTGFQPPLRRMETVRTGDYTIVSDVAMNPASYDAVLKTVLPKFSQCVVVNAIRGNRGAAINSAIAGVFADWNHQKAFAPLLLSLSGDSVQGLAIDHRVRSEELDAFLERAQDQQLSCEVYSHLSEAIRSAVERLRSGGALVLLGTFGMDDGVALATAMLGDPRPAPPSAEDFGEPEAISREVRR